MMAKRSVLVMGAIFLSAFALLGSASADDLGLKKKEDFAELARRGFAETVDGTGAFVVNTGNQGNSYTWATIWWPAHDSEPGRFYVGTNADAGCTVSTGGGALIGTCPTPTAIPTGTGGGTTQVPIPGPEQLPEIWRYTPDVSDPPDVSDDPRKGIWEKVFTSPLTSLQAVSPSINPVACFLPQFAILCAVIFARDFGYRNMILCDANGAGTPTQRLFAVNYGLGGRILFTETGNPGSWQQTSTLGLPNTDPSAGGTYGFRAMACKDGGLWISPSGTATNTDASTDGRIFFNPNPTNLSSAWRAISPAGVCDAANTGVFSMDTFNGFVYAGAGGAPTGAQVCKTAGCLGGTPSTCTATWTQVVSDGAGRELLPDGEQANAGVIRMKDALGAVYVGLGTSAGENLPAELIRIHPDDTFDLIMGIPRIKSEMEALFGITGEDPPGGTFNCNNDPGGGGPIDINKCFPLSHQGAGFGGGYSAVAADNYCSGKDVYVWSFAEYDSNGDGSTPELYVGALDRGGGGGATCASNSSNPEGFDLWRSDDGNTYSPVSLNGMGNSFASGIRNMAGVPGVGLFVGSTNANTNQGILDPPLTPNPLTGGLQIWLGTCAPDGPLVADAGDNTTFFDNGLAPDTNPAAIDGKVTAALDGSRSANRFCGHAISYEWYQGAVAAGCAGLSGPFSTNPTVSGISLCTGSDFTDCPPRTFEGLDFAEYTYTLKVTADDQPPSCDEVVIRASANLPPKATITTPGVPQIGMLDVNGDGSEPLSLTGTCTDFAPNAALASCVWSVALPGVDFSPPTSNTDCPGGFLPPCITTSTTATVQKGGELDILLTATDDHGNKHVAVIQVEVEGIEHDVRVISITTAAPATVGIPQQVTVRVRNRGNVPETFNVTLQEPGGTVVLAPPPTLPVTLAACPVGASGNSCPTTDVKFTWTPTTAGLHTLTATAATVPGETDTSNNVATRQVEVEATPLLVAAALPSSRAVEVGGAVASFFGTILNIGPGTAMSCRIAPVTVLPGPPAFSYQTTNCATNLPTGPPDTPTNIAAGQPGCFAFYFTPSVAFSETQVQLSYDCDNTNPAPNVPLVNTVQLLASDDPVSDIVALAATSPINATFPFGDLIVRIPTPLPNIAAFGVATVNVGAPGTITASASAGGLPLTLSICETTDQLPVGACLAPPAASVITVIAAGGTNTFSIFVTATGTVVFNPGTNRIQVDFTGGGGGGGTSVAVCTASCPPAPAP
jgi:hypothetical protein